ncbi:MAG: glycosyltransferase family 2 protein [Candidatus Eremiobacteraeota bacterium]|nr:glycosyltransferase family 2 protein [Candidatus Eremiobacteraeota bacterium]
MATWNGARFLNEQLKSVIPQLGSEDEIVVVDDASSDSTLEILRRTAVESQAPPIRIQQNERNLGPVRSFERALASARGEILLLCDQDDRWLPGKVQRIRTVFELNPNTTLVVTDGQLIDGNGEVLDPSLTSYRRYRPGLLRNLVSNTFVGCTMAFRRSSLQYCLPIPAGTPMHDQWIGLLHTIYGSVDYIDEPLIQYRRHSSNATADRHASWVRMVNWRWSLTTNLLGRWWKSTVAAVEKG